MVLSIFMRRISCFSARRLAPGDLPFQWFGSLPAAGCDQHAPGESSLVPTTCAAPGTKKWNINHFSEVATLE
jgi:hypothetical protein